MIVSIEGMDGVGKTTVARNIEKDLGFVYVKDSIDLIKEAEVIANKVLTDNTKANYVDYNKVKLGIREKLGKFYYQKTESRPMIIIVVQEI